MFGHAGDDNVHYAALIDPDDEAAVERAKMVYDGIVEQAVEWGGTATGEHGIGMGERRVLELEYGAGGVDVTRAVKRVPDPGDVLSPGRMFPETEAEGGRVDAPDIG